MQKTAPGTAVIAPPISSIGENAPGPKLASHSSVGDGAVSEAGKRVLYVGKVDMWVGTGVLRNNRATDKSQTRTDNQTCFRRSALKQ